jgi:hypothetical protein
VLVDALTRSQAQTLAGDASVDSRMSVSFSMREMFGRDVSRHSATGARLTPRSSRSSESATSSASRA